jgi:holo-[acyl-carrier protein] synthase
MILGIGIDLCKISRIETVLNRFGERFKNRCFTINEIKKCDNINNKAACYAKRFASKEAVSKALGTGISRGVYWKHIEIINMKSGKPSVTLKGNAKKILNEMTPKSKKNKISITISDENGLAQALVLIEAI